MARDLAARIHVASGRLFVALWALVVLDLALPLPGVRRAAEATIALLIALALLRASAHIRVLAVVLLGASAAIAVRAGDWTLVERGLRAALAVGAFLPVVALLRATVRSSPTIPAIRRRIGAMSVAERRAWMTGGAHLLGAILTLGYVSVQRPMLPDDLSDDERLSLAECGTRGLGLSALWSPVFFASAMANQLVPQVPAWQIVALGLALAAAGGLVAHAMFNRELGAAALARAVRRLVPIVVPTGLLVGVVVLTSTITGWRVLQSVIVVVPAACVGYVLLHARERALGVVHEVVTGAGNMRDEVLIFCASSMFGTAVAGAAMPDSVASSMALLHAVPGLAIAAGVVVIATLGVLGLHPMVSASVLVPAALAFGLPIAELVLSHIVIVGWSLSGTIAAWTVPVVVTAAGFGVPVRALVFGANARFVVVHGLVAVSLLVALNRVLT